MLEVTCNGCGAKYKAPEKFAGRKMSCKACSGVILIGGETAEPPSLPAAEEEAQQAPPAREEKTPGKKKISFKKGGIPARKGGKKHSFKKGGISKSPAVAKAAESKGAESKVHGSEEKSSGKKSPAVLVLVLLLVVGGLAALDYFVFNMVIGGGEPGAEGPEMALGDGADASGDPTDRAEEPAEPDTATSEAPGGSDPTEEPVVAVEELPEEIPEEPVAKAPAPAEIPAAAVPVASIIPVDAKFILGLNVPRIIQAVEGISGEKLPRTAREIVGLGATLGDENADERLESLEKLFAAGFDPFNNIQRILIAVESPEKLSGMLPLGGGGGLGGVATSEAVSVTVDPDSEPVPDPVPVPEPVPEPVTGESGTGAQAGGDDAVEKPGLDVAGADGLVIIEGKFDDPAAIIKVLVETEALSPSEPVVRGGLNIYSVPKDAAAGTFSDHSYFAFLSRHQMMFASAAWLEKVIALKKGEGESIGSNEVFSGMTRAFTRKEAAWLVAAVPKEAGAVLQQGLSVPPVGIPGLDDEAEAPAPAIKIESLMLALDSGDPPFSLELIGATPSDEDAENTKKTIGTQLGGLSLLAMQFGPKAFGLMGKLMPKSEGKNVIISFTLSEQEIATIKEMAGKAFSEFTGPRGLDGAGELPDGIELPEGFDPSDFKKPGEVGENDGAGKPGVAAEPGSDEAVTILISGADGAALKKKLSSVGEPGESVFFKLNDLVLAAAQKADSGIDSISGSLDDDVASFEVGPVKDLEAFAGKIALGKVVKVDAAKRTIELELVDPGEKPGEEPEAPTDPEPPADPKKKDADEEEDPLELEDF